MHKTVKDRVSSGVTGLDQILGGGYVKGRSVLITGGPGTGKSILSWQFLFNGIKRGENGILLSFDQTTEMIKADMNSFGWDPESLSARGRLFILSGSLGLVPTQKGYEYTIVLDHPVFHERPFTAPNLVNLLRQRITETSASRVVVDGLGPILELASDKSETRQLVYGLVRDLSSPDVTFLFTQEIGVSSDPTSTELAQFLVDGVIRLDVVPHGGDYVRTIRIIKMRGTNHLMRPVLFKIDTEGIVVFPYSKLSE